MILAIDLDQVLANYCVSSAPGTRTTVPQLHTLKVHPLILIVCALHTSFVTSAVFNPAACAWFDSSLALLFSLLSVIAENPIVLEHAGAGHCDQRQTHSTGA
jgi:hypothetical protein